MVEDVSLDEPGTALVVVDVQNDFADPAGSLYVRGADKVVAAVDDLVREAIAGGAPVFYTRDHHPRSSPHFVDEGGIWPVHCVGGTWGAEPHPDLVVAGEVVLKGTGGEDGYSGFTARHPVTGEVVPTALEGLLRERGVDTVVVTGLATDYCVKATALDAVERGFRTIVPTRAVAAVDLEPGDGERALEELRRAGVAVV